MNIKELSYFYELTQQKNFTKVADLFKVSQPTISSSIRRLEREMDTRLFKRDQSHHEVVVTALGKQLAVHVESILGELEVARQELQHLRQEQIRFGVSPSIASAYIPQVSSQLDKINLLSQLKMFETGSRDLLDLLRNGQIDLALLATLTPIDRPEFQAYLIKYTKFKIIVGKQNKLATRKTVTFKELRDQRFLTLNESFAHAAAFRQLVHRNRMKPEIIYQGNNISLLKGMVARDIGVGFLAELAIHRSDPVHVLAIEDAEQPKFIITLVYRKSHLLSPAQEQFIRILESCQNAE